MEGWKCCRGLDEPQYNHFSLLALFQTMNPVDWVKDDSGCWRVLWLSAIMDVVWWGCGVVWVIDNDRFYIGPFVDSLGVMKILGGMKGQDDGVVEI